jgi:hypothetical protein
MPDKRWLIIMLKALLISWALPYMTTYFDVGFVGEAGGPFAMPR